MAMINSGLSAKSKYSKVRIASYVFAAAVLLAIIWLMFNFAGLQAQAKLGASFASHISCSCRYIEGRDLKSCLTDFEPGMELVSVTDDPKSKRITASVPLLAKAMAEYRGKNGCVQLNQAEIDKIG